MLDVILAIKFVHMVAMALMLGGWCAIALFMVFGYRSGNPSVAAVTAVFVVRAELMLMIPAVALQPLTGFPLAVAIGAPLDDFWVELSVALYAVIVAAWLAALIIELRIRKVAQEAALSRKRLPDSYRRMFRAWSAVTAAGLAGMIAVMVLMLWQPHWD